MSATVSVEQVVVSYANERGKYDLSTIKRYEKIVIEGYSDLNMNYVIYPNYTTGVVNEANIFSLPADFVDYLKIGVLKNGKIHTLSENSDIALSMPDVCGVETNNNTTAMEYPWFTDYTRPGGWNVANYRIDKTRRRIVFEGAMMGETIHLPYISTGIPSTGQVFVPRDMMPVLKNYLDWTIKRRDDDMPLSKSEVARRDFYESLAQYERSNNSMTADEILDAIRSGYTQGPKR